MKTYLYQLYAQFCPVFSTHFIESQSFHLATPSKPSEKVIILLGRIPEPVQVLPKHDNGVRAFLPCLSDFLELVEPMTTCYIVAGDNYMFLLHSKG